MIYGGPGKDLIDCAYLKRARTMSQTPPMLTARIQLSIAKMFMRIQRPHRIRRSD